MKLLADAILAVVRDDAIQAVAARLSFHRPHQPKLHAARRPCSSIQYVPSGWTAPCDRSDAVESKPPTSRTPKIGGALEKRQSMEIGKRSSDFIILSVSCLYSVHRPNLESHLPNVILTPSQTAATKPVTMIVITALKV